MQDEFIKFRVKPDEKQRLAAFAKDSDTSVSALLRRAANNAAAGRRLTHNAKVDIVAMRSAANALKAAIDDIGLEPSGPAARLHQAATDLHRIAARQLDASRDY